MRAKSFSMATTMPLRTLPSRPLPAPMDSSSRAEKFSLGDVVTWAALAMAIRSFLFRCSGRPVESGGLGNDSRSGLSAGEVRQDAADMGNRQGENAIGIQLRAVDDEGILGRGQGCHRAIAIAGVTGLHVLQNAAVYTRNPPL